MQIRTLRAEAHRLMDEVLPVTGTGKKKRGHKIARYLWLHAHFRTVHMSQCTKHELYRLIVCLNAKKHGDWCIVHEKIHTKPKIKKTNEESRWFTIKNRLVDNWFTIKNRLLYNRK